MHGLSVDYRWFIPLLLFPFLLSPAAAQTSANGSQAEVTLPLALSGVRWEGRAPSAEMLAEKTAVVLVYATWCPLCNKWSPELFRDLREAAAKSPVVIFAINADENGSGSQYARQLNFLGPNIIHGSDPSIVRRLGLESDLFRYLVFSPEGIAGKEEAAGARYTETKKFKMALDLESGQMGGQFSVLTNEMSDQMRTIFWPVEMGQGFDERALIAARKKIPNELQADFNNTVRGILERREETIKTLMYGEISQQLAGYELAQAMAKDFGSTSQGRNCQKAIDLLKDNQSFQSELAAKKSYQSVAEKSFRMSESAFKQSMSRVAKRFPDTHYGKLAEQSRNSGVVAAAK